ncbi:phage tail tape measure protein [Roseovarius sp. SK2]|uniref:phage tail tape measure protein n=1 Tax=Roseovarius TaxID=74030 RepID=UPI00237A366E|nr:phage tail tape measure protein [Roseovarius sp. SK2]MDD9726146.1 phage tail tape measure protein [Roseovarius sp. SK2]
MDIVELGMDVDGRPLKFTREEMQRFVKAGKDVDGAARGVEKSTNAMGAAMARAAAGIAAAATAAISLGTAVQQARQFGAAMGEASTLLQGTREEMDLMETEARRLGVTFGTGAKAQVEAFYQAISAGAGDVAEATRVLEASNKLAIGGVTNVTTAVDILTTATNVYAASGLTAEDASDALFVAMKAGKTTIDELAGSLGKVLPLASNLGVTFDETAAAVAALTKGGISTAESVTGLRAAMTAILGPSKQAQDLAEQLGINFNAAGLEALGFAGFMEEVVAKTGGSSEAMQTLFSSVEATTVALALAGEAGNSLGVILTDMANKSGATADAYNKMASTLDQRLNRAMSALADIGLTVGNMLLTVAVPALEATAAVALLVADNLEVFGIAVASLAATRLPALVLSLRAATAGLTLMQAQFIAGAVAARGMAAAAAVARGAIAFLGGPIGVVLGLTTAAAAAFITYRDNVETTEQPQYDAAAATAALMGELDALASDAGPAAQAAVIALANDNRKLASSAYEAAKAELAKRKAMAEGAAANFAPGPVQRSLSYQAEQAVKDLAEAERGLEQAMRDRQVVSEQIVMTQPVVNSQTKTAIDQAKDLADQIDRAGGSAKTAGKAAKDLGKEVEKVTSEAEAFEKAMADAAYTAEDFGKAKAQAVISGVEGISEAWADFVVNGFNDFKGFVDSVLGSFKSMIAQMIATAARNKILIGLGVAGGGGLAGTAASAAGGVGGLAGGGGILGNVLGGGGLLGNLLGGTGGLLGGVMGGAQAALGLGGFSSAGIFNIGANAAVASAATGAGSLASTIGAALPAVGLVAGGIALISSFFKTTTKLLNEGLRVEVEDSVTSIRQFQDIQKKKYWGLSKSNSRNFSEVPEEFQRAWDNTLSGITGALGSAAEQLGLAGENFLSVWDGYNMDISTKGLSEDEIQQKVSEFFQQYASDIVAYGLDKSGVGMFAVIRDEVLREGEELSDGFIRMGNAISVANRNLRDLNVALFDISVQGGVYAAQFADMFGGVENMQAAMNGYIQAMFSEQGQLIVRQRRLVEALSAVGVGLPATSEAYREMVEAQDLTTERGREVAATLIQLSGEFVALEDALGSLGYTVASLSTAVIEATFSAEDALEAARARAVQEYQNVMRLFGEQIRAAEQAAAEIRRVFDILDDALASRGLLSERAEMMRRETALNELRAGINDPDRLRDVVRTLNAPSEQYFGNAIDYARDFAITSGAMAAQRDIAREQLTEAEQQIVLLEEQRDAIEDQYAELLGINEGVTTLNEAIAQLDLTMQEVRDATMRVEQAMLSLANSMLGAISGIAGAGGAAGLGMAGIDQFDENRTNAILSDAATSTFTGVAETINRLYRDTLGRNVDAAGLEFYGGLLQSGQANAARIGFDLATSQEAQSGVTPGFGEIGSAQPVNTIDALYSSMLGREADAAGRAFWESTGLQGEDLINAFRDGAIANGDTPAFAMGGMHAGGLRIVGENGPELEATGPSRIYSARQTREIMQPSTTLGAEMRQLIEYTRQLVKINNKQERALREIELQGETA